MSKIALGQVKIHHALSEETTAFNANLYFEGKVVGTVKNRGTGGANEITAPVDVVMAMSNWARSLPPYTDPRCPKPLEMDLDFHISLLVERHVVREEVRKLMRDRILLTSDGKTMQQTKKLTAERRAELLANPAKLLRPGERVLTEDEAVEILFVS